ncbi:uncharacterized protein E0L32_005085 [Thyridium curvatum]|uniref:Small secreted protein n=1 Tax=Thyridium curvatum TaxID=1093900 RepID=A0A507BDU9_9PEZI|nr:uncharacterized protein E0L32_005085 [Thyridium curvatum]TPX14690.1 hypothetical protein E0L32_005085 [Thyridium curvatum]
MYFSKIAVVLSLALSAIAAPAGTSTTAAAAHNKRALTFRPYNSFQISDGVGGGALQAVNAAFPVGNDPASISAADLAVLKAARQTAENAESAFNDAISAAGGTKSAAGAPLQVGKIRNKVLKLRLFEMVVSAEQAAGRGGAAAAGAKLADIRKKLASNVATDTKSAGQASKGVAFAADVRPKA